MKKKKTSMRTVIRQIVREEVAMAIQEVITELKQPTQQIAEPTQQISQPTVKTIVESPEPYKKYSKNSVLNDVLNETAMDGDWKTMGEGVYDTSKANEIIGSTYSDLMNGDKSSGEVNPDAMVASMDINPTKVSKEVKDNIFKKDYRSLLKAMDKKANQSRGA